MDDFTDVYFKILKQCPEIETTSKDVNYNLNFSLQIKSTISKRSYMCSL